MFDPLFYRQFCFHLDAVSTTEEAAYTKSAPRDGVDIFSKKILVFPIGDGKVHWSTAVVLNPESLEVCHPMRFNILRSFYLFCTRY